MWLAFKMHKVIGLIVTAVVWLLVSTALSVLAETNEAEYAMITDSDGDGMTDWDEWQAGTNPGDPTNCFKISACKIEDAGIVIGWRGVGSFAYEIVGSATIAGLTTSPQHVAYAEPVGGTAPWFETLSTTTNSPVGDNMFFRIRLIASQDFDQSALDMATFE